MLTQERSSCTELECVPAGYLFPVVHLLETTSMRPSCENPRSRQCNLLCLPTRSPLVSRTKIFSAAALQVKETYTRGRAVLSCGGKAWCKQGSADGKNGEETKVPQSQHSLSDLRSIIRLFLNNQPLQPNRVTQQGCLLTGLLVVNFERSESRVSKL